MNNLDHVLMTSGSGLLFAALIILIARRGILSMRYTLGWLFVAGVVIVGGVVSGLVEPVADALGVDPATLIVGCATVGLLGITVQLSITVSGLTELARTLAESHALLEERVHRLEPDAHLSISDAPSEVTTGPTDVDA